MSSLFCRRCRHPLRPDQAVLDSIPDLIAMTTVPWTEIYNETFLQYCSAQESAIESTEESSSPLSLTQSGTSSIGRLSSSSRPQLPKELRNIPAEYLLEGLLTYAYDAYDVDLPVCKECMDIIVREFEAQFEEHLDRTKTYEKTCKLVESEKLEPMDETEFAEKLKALENEEKELSQKLRQLNIEREGIHKEAIDLETKRKHLESLSENYFEELNEYKLEHTLFLRDRAAVQTKIETSTTELERLKCTNVLNDVFVIWHDGVFGTINGFRLGRIPSIPVEWNEINAGLGQVALLLDTISRKYDIEFTRYRLSLQGSSSRISKKDDDRNFNELYGSNDLGIGRLFWARRFDEGLTWLLFCVSEIIASLQRRGCQVNCPYPIIADTVGQISIRAQVNDDERWTKCLKYLLIDLKWIIAVIARSAHLLG